MTVKMPELRVKAQGFLEGVTLDPLMEGAFLLTIHCKGRDYEVVHGSQYTPEESLDQVMIWAPEKDPKDFSTVTIKFSEGESFYPFQLRNKETVYVAYIEQRVLWPNDGA